MNPLGYHFFSASISLIKYNNLGFTWDWWFFFFPFYIFNDFFFKKKKNFGRGHRGIYTYEFGYILEIEIFYWNY